MKINNLNKSSSFFLALFVLSIHGYSQKKDFSVKIESYKNNLSKTEFRSDRGEISAYIITNMKTFTGSVVSIPDGSTQGEVTKNENFLNGLVIEAEMEDGKKETVSVKDSKLSVSLPEKIEVLNLVLKNQAGKELSRAVIPLSHKPNVNEISGKEAVSPLMEAGMPAMIPGKFNGDFNDTKISIDEIDVALLAECAGGVYVEVPLNIEGTAKVVVKEADKVSHYKTAVYHILITAEKQVLEKGESAIIQFRVTGLPIDLPSGVGVDVRNFSSATVELSGGNEQLISILPGEITSEGNYSKDFKIIAINRGNFSIYFDLTQDAQLPQSIGERRDSLINNSMLNNKTGDRLPGSAPTITRIHPQITEQGNTIELTISGKDFVEGIKVSFSHPEGINIISIKFINTTELKVILNTAKDAFVGPRDIIMTNPDLQSFTLRNAFTIIEANPLMDLSSIPVIKDLSAAKPFDDEQDDQAVKEDARSESKSTYNQNLMPDSTHALSLPALMFPDMLLSLPSVLAGFTVFFLLIRKGKAKEAAGTPEIKMNIGVLRYKQIQTQTAFDI